MGSLKLPHASGNSVSIAAPQSNPASDRTLYLPSNADGTVLTNTTPGTILQVTSKLDTSDYSTTGNSFFQGPETATFTLTNSSNKVLVTANFMLYMDARSGQYLSNAAALYRGNIASGTQISTGGQPMHYRSAANATEYYIAFNTIQWLDTPGGNTTYSLAVKNNNNNGLAAVIKGSQQTTSITLMEVAV